MTRQICGNCKFKGKPVTRFDYEKCEDVETGYFACDLIKHDEGNKYLPKLGAVVVDGSGYFAALCVESDFGCNKWSDK